MTTTTGRDAADRKVVRRREFDAVIFDLDGVITDTAAVHQASWKRLFDEELQRRADDGGEAFRPFTEADYHAYVDGMPRYDGVRTFLASRGIILPEGDPADPPERETVCGLGNRKNEYFRRTLHEDGVVAYPTSVALLQSLHDAGITTALVSSSRNAAPVLEAAGLLEEFATRVDGVVAADEGLPGKPDPTLFLEAARRVGVEPSRAVVVEDAQSGVEAGRRGRFGLVVGVDRVGQAEALLASGADVVVQDLGELRVEGNGA